MAVGGGTQQSLRKALGVLKDSTTVGLAKVNSDYKELDVAIVKATNHVEEFAKEKHMRAIFDAVSASRPRADVAYCIQGLAKRLAKTHNWAVALKTLIVVHRALREVDFSFHEVLVKYSRSRGLMLNLSHFKDDSSPNAWDYSAWVRTYALYLEERLECLCILKYDIETDRSVGAVGLNNFGHLDYRKLSTPDLLEQLPALQQLLFRLLACQPEGAATYNKLIRYALSMVAGESVRLYVTVTDGILNLVDKFFEMQRHDAIRALEIYRKAGSQAERLSEFFEICRGLDFGRGQKFIKIEQPPSSFMTAMEDYVNEAPRPLMLQWTEINDDRGATPKKVGTSIADVGIDHKQDNDVQQKSDPSVTSPEPPNTSQNEVATSPEVADFLGLDELILEASALDEKNSLALAIVTSENPPNSVDGLNLTCQTSWELALVTAPSSNKAAVAESKLAGGLDKLTLDSLYDDVMARRSQNGSYHMGQVAPNPFELVHIGQDPFYASSNIAPPTNVQMAAISQQQEAFILQQQPDHGQDPINPFGNPFVGQAAPSYPSHNTYSGLI